MERKDFINIFMKIVNPDFRHDWDFVKYYFDNHCKYPITKEEWEKWMEDKK